jgi:hypothetical protein
MVRRMVRIHDDVAPCPAVWLNGYGDLALGSPAPVQTGDESVAADVTMLDA